MKMITINCAWGGIILHTAANELPLHHQEAELGKFAQRVATLNDQLDLCELWATKPGYFIPTKCLDTPAALEAMFDALTGEVFGGHDIATGLGDMVGRESWCWLWKR